jgi:hypothetical protein
MRVIGARRIRVGIFFIKISEDFCMSRYKSDDGTFWMGLFAAGMAICGFCAGYTIRDSGYVLGATQAQPQQGIKAK